MSDTLKRIADDILAALRMPKVTVDLMLRETAGNDPFFAKIVSEYYASTRNRLRKFPLVREDQIGVAMLRLPRRFDDYFMAVEASARRNYKKAARGGYRFARIDYNAHLRDIAEIRASAEVRQGRMPEHLLSGSVSECRNPASKTDAHDYPYFGVLLGEKLVAYAGCLVSGQICMIEQVFGHAEHQPNGVVPMLIIDIVRYLLDHHPRVLFYAYGTTFGAGVTMRRFKRKLGFLPCRVEWLPG